MKQDKHDYEYLKKYWADSNEDGYQKLIAEKTFLHENSVFLVNLLKENGVLDEIKSVFEMGCGCARNLAYIFQAKTDITVAGNDLSSTQCFKYMDESIKDEIIFYEQDSKLIVDTDDVEVDLFMSIDHLMHLDVETVQYIIDKVKNKWKPTYILLRNSEDDRLNKKPFVYLHDFSELDEKYELIVSTKNTGKTKKSGFKVLLYRRKENV